MFFVDLSKVTSGEEAAQKANFADINNLIKTDVNIQKTNEFFQGAPGRTAANLLESNRQVAVADLLQPQIPTIAQADTNSILGKAATRSLAGILAQKVEQFTLPVIPTLAQNKVDTQVANSNNAKTQAQYVVPIQQDIAIGKGNDTLRVQPQTFDIQQAQRDQQEAKLQTNAQLLPFKSEGALQGAQLAQVQQQVAQLNLVKPSQLTSQDATVRGTTLTNTLRARGIVGAGDVVTSKDGDWVVLGSNGVSEPVGDLLKRVNGAVTSTTPVKQTSAQAIKPTQYDYYYTTNENGEKELQTKIKTFGAPIDPSLLPQQSAPAPTAEAPTSAFIGDTKFLMTPEDTAALRQSLNTPKAQPSQLKEASDAIIATILKDPGLNAKAQAILATNVNYAKATPEQRKEILEATLLEVAGIKREPVLDTTKPKVVSSYKDNAAYGSFNENFPVVKGAAQ